MNRAKLCRPGNRRWIHDGIIVDRKTVPACQLTSVDRWHRLPNNMSTNCRSCLRLRTSADERVYIQTGARRRYFDRFEDAQRVAEAIFERTGCIVGIMNASATRDLERACADAGVTLQDIGDELVRQGLK